MRVIRCVIIKFHFFRTNYLLEPTIIMKRLTYPLLLAIVSCSSPSKTTDQQAESTTETVMQEPASFELRTYYAAEGKLDQLLARFKNHTIGIFEKYGMVNVAYWVPVNNEENQLIYLLGYNSREDRTNAWEQFRNDPDWLKAKADSEVNGPLVDSVKNVFLNPTDYSPKMNTSLTGPRVFEMRTYYTHENKLVDLHVRFKDHTMGIFENQNMTNVAYFNLDKDQEEPENTLLYFIAHADTEAAIQNWKGFLDDPAWKAAYAASIENGKLVNNLTSQFLEAVDFSPLK